ncbi:MAG TPA: tyrosine-type recombinase/integrase [Armatimonadota bacterium]|nr:tyrosine-type recombinase/integrase [Armatimonadota bacterium]
MAKPLPSDNRFSFTLFKRPATDGRVIFYARYIQKATGTILSRRSLGTDDEREALAQAGRLMSQLSLPEIAKSKVSKIKESLEASERLRNMDLAAYFTWFWTPGASDYLRDRVDAERPLSYYYILTQGRYIAKHAAGYGLFKKTPLREASLYLIETWMHHLKRAGVKSNVLIKALAAIRTPLSWAAKRKLLDQPFSLTAIVRPKEHHEKRGILSRAEVARIVALPALENIVPRPRLKGGNKNESPAPIDLRQKAVVLLSELAAMRRGEIRALRWRCVDFDRKLISIEGNFIDSDGFKEPKRESFGVVPIAKKLETVLTDLKVLASKLGRAEPEDFVVFNKSRDVPVAEVTIRRGFHRALALIGIEDDSSAAREGRPPKPGSQQARRLVLHSGRHEAATRLAEQIGPRDAARITRHRSAQAFAGYADHREHVH